MDLFTQLISQRIQILPNVMLLKGFALKDETALLHHLHLIINQAPLRQMMTKMGFLMSAAMTNCGQLGWVSDRKGYRYDALDPLTHQAWPAMPVCFLQLAQWAATEAGFSDFQPDACLINQYKLGTSMGLHQDKNEQDYTQPIVSVSLGIPAIFGFGGSLRTDKIIKIPLAHGDVVVWGGKVRQNFHRILPLKTNTHPLLGSFRYNLTFRRAG